MSAAPQQAETSAELVGRLLAEQLAIIRRNEPRARRGTVEGLHHIRVALRRMRTLAMTFRDLDRPFFRRLNRRAAKACDRMGDARDLDVWIQLFRKMARPGAAAGLSAHERRAVLQLLDQERDRLAADALDSRIFRRVKKMVRQWLRRRRKIPAPPPEVLAARRMLAVREQIAERYRRVGRFSSGPAHDLRRAGRRMRYLSEFFAPLLGPVAVRAGRWITRAQAALGKVHDCDTALILSRQLPSGPARRKVQQQLRRTRASHLRKFKAAWRHYASPRLQKAWLARLQAAAGR